MIRGFRTRRAVHACHAIGIVIASLIPDAAGAQTAPPMARVRSEHALIAGLIADAKALSTTFRSLVEAIDATDGIVYVASGQCGRGARACLVHSMQIAGPHRLLRVLVDTRRDRWGLAGAIGHELQHAVEVLRQPEITTTQEMFFYFFGSSTSATVRFETKEAIDAGLQIEHELKTR